MDRMRKDLIDSEYGDRNEAKYQVHDCRILSSWPLETCFLSGGMLTVIELVHRLFNT